MIWHIFKKDLRLLWPFGLAAAILQFAIVAVHLKLGVFEEQPIFSSVLLLLEIHDVLRRCRPYRHCRS